MPDSAATLAHGGNLVMVVRVAPSRSDLDALAARAEELLAASQWQEGLAAVDQVLAESPAHVHGLHLRVVALQNLARWEDAVATAREAIRLAPHDPSGHYLLAKGLWQTEHDREALDAIDRAITLEPYAPLYRYTLARFVFDTDPARAEELLERIVADEPARADALNDLGVLRERRGARDEARALYQRAVRADPRLALAARNLGAMSPLRSMVTGAFARLGFAVASRARGPERTPG